MTWLGFLLRNLLRRPGRSTFTLLGIGLAIGSFLTLSSIARGMDEAARAALEERGIHLVVTKRGMVEFFASVLPQDLADAIRRVPGVVEVAPELANLVPAGEETHALVAGWPADSFQWRGMTLARGRLPQPGERGVIILGEALADALRADVGATVELDFTRFQVVGVSSYGNTFNRAMGVMALDDLQALIARPRQVTLFYVRVADPGQSAHVEAARRAIMALRPDLRVSTADDVLRDNRALSIIASASAAVALVALAMACLSVLNTLAMSVEERTREIGVLSAIGWSRGRILRLIVGEGLVLTTLGGLLGSVLGVAGNSALSFLFVPDSGFSVHATVRLVVVAQAAALVVGTLGAIYPAWRAGRLDAAVALRHQ